MVAMAGIIVIDRLVILAILLVAWFYMASALRKEPRWLKLFVPFIILAFAIITDFFGSYMLEFGFFSKENIHYIAVKWIESALILFAAIGFVYVSFSSFRKLRGK